MFLRPSGLTVTLHALILVTTETAGNFKAKNFRNFGKYSLHFSEILSFLVTAPLSKIHSSECSWEAKTTKNCTGINLEQF